MTINFWGFLAIFFSSIILCNMLIQITHMITAKKHIYIYRIFDTKTGKIINVPKEAFDMASNYFDKTLGGQNAE